MELKEVKLTEGYYVMDPKKAIEMVDENTICVAAILGSTLTGEYEDVKLLNDLLVAKNKETGYVFSMLSIIFSHHSDGQISLKLCRKYAAQFDICLVIIVMDNMV